MSFRILIRKLTTGNPNSSIKIPVFVIPNPFEWLSVKLAGNQLKQKWDKDFNTDAFCFGAKQAAITTTHFVKERDFSGLVGLFTSKALDDLKEEVSKWPVNAINGLSLSEIQVTKITRIGMQTIVDRKFCDIDVMEVAVKELPSSINMYQFKIRFHRDYTEGKLPDWTITKFALENFRDFKI